MLACLILARRMSFIRVRDSEPWVFHRAITVQLENHQYSSAMLLSKFLMDSRATIVVLCTIRAFRHACGDLEETWA